MPTASLASVRHQIASGSPDRLYFLQGEDEVEKAALAHEFETLVEEELRPFNVDRIYVGEATTGEKLAGIASSVVAAARTLPMMSTRRVVLVLQADGLLVPKRESEAGARALDQLEELFTRPESDVTVVFVAGAVDKRSRMYKTLSRRATVVECGVIETLADAERWIRNRVTAAGAEIEPAGARLLAERDGVNVKRLRNDVEQLLLYALGQRTITEQDVREVAGPAALQDDWAMTNAIEAGETPQALRQLALLLDAGAPPEKILGQLGWVVRTKFPAIAPKRLRAAVESVFRTDVDLKRTAGDARFLLERLVVELCDRSRAATRRA